MQDTKRKWLIKNVDGRIRGPYSTGEVIKKINSGQLSGDEFISLYPGGNWQPISNDPNFYDVLLDQLLGASGDQGIVENFEETNSKEYSAEEKSPEYDDPDKTILKSAKDQEDVNIELDDDIEEDEFSERPAGEAVRGSAHKVNRRGEREKTNSTEQGKTKKQRPKGRSGEKAEDIELKNVKKIVKKKKRGKLLRPILISTLIIILSSWLLFDNPLSDDNSIKLISPRKGQAAISKAKKVNLVKKASNAFVMDNFSNYRRAENFLVQVIEGDPQNAEALSLLCVTHLELWPFTKRGADDLKVVSNVKKWSEEVDAGGLNSSTCKAVYFYLKGDAEEVQRIVEVVLDQYSYEKKPPTLFYYFKALLLKEAREYDPAIGYATSAQKHWPQWLKVYSLEAQVADLLNKKEYAAKRYKQILKSNPGHLESKIEYGFIEVIHFRHYEKGRAILQEALESKEPVRPGLIAKAHLGLAAVMEYQGDKKGALSQAKQCYKLKPAELRCKDLILKYGGEKSLSETRVQDKQFVIEGDQLAREGDCSSAQAHYKTAYELNKKNANAALKAGKCLWKLSFSAEAIKWVNKAIKADYKLIPAYVLLADYYTQRYNFEAAAKALKKANKIAPKSYEVFRGYALVELRRNSPKGAAAYAKRALALYGSDVEAQIILSKANFKLKKYQEAYNIIAQSIEIEPSHKEAQIHYAEVLAGLQGVSAGVSYLEKLIQIYPRAYEYRVAMGKMLNDDDRLEAAEKQLKTVINLTEKPKEAYLELAKVVAKQGKAAEAQHLYLMAAAIDPSDVRPIFESGLLYLDTKKPGQAKINFQKVKSINKRFPLVNYYIGKAALDMNAPEETLKYAQKEAYNNPKLADSYILAAEAYYKMKKHHLCAQEFQKAIRLRPMEAYIYIKVAECYRLSGYLEAASDILDQAATKESGLAEIYREKARIYKAKGDFNSATENYEYYFKLNPEAQDREQVEIEMRSLSK